MNRTLIWQLAWRYLRGKRSANAVTILSRISMVAIGVSAAAIMIIFSVCNGLISLVKDQYKAFYPDVRICVSRGKFFPVDTARLATLKKIKGVQGITTVIEDNVLAVDNDQQKVITVKGIDNNYLLVNDLDQYINRGSDTLTEDKTISAISGRRIMDELGADIASASYITLNYPDPTVKDPTTNPLGAYGTLKVSPVGSFHISDEFDNKYLLAPLASMQALFHQQGNCSSIEIKTDPGYAADVQKQAQQLFGNRYKAETRYEQNKTIYVVLSTEKWAIYGILVLVLLIAAFNMVGALSMLVLEKQKDIGILKAMGADAPTIRMIFLAEGVLWALAGGIAGILLGTGLCLLQQKYGFIKMGSSFVIDAYPVELQVPDILLDLLTILAVGLLAAWYPAMRANRATDLSLKST